VPFYFPSTIENAVRFYRDLAAEFSDLAIMIYHNPTLHHVTLPIRAMTELAEVPNIVAMKDAHRETRDFVALQRATHGQSRMAVPWLSRARRCRLLVLRLLDGTRALDPAPRRHRDRADRRSGGYHARTLPAP
jgi:hypothetical protein